MTRHRGPLVLFVHEKLAMLAFLRYRLDVGALAWPRLNAGSRLGGAGSDRLLLAVDDLRSSRPRRAQLVNGARPEAQGGEKRK